MKILYYGLVGALALSVNLKSQTVWAIDDMDKRESLEKIEKDIAKDKEKLANKKAEIITAQSKMDKDVAQFGSTSSEVRDDRNNLMGLRNDFVDLKADLFKDLNKKKVAQGHSIETDTSCMS